MCAVVSPRCDVPMDKATQREVGAAMVAALTRRDFHAMAALMAPGSHLRALLPGRVVDDAGDGGAALAALLTTWFGGGDAFEVEDASVGQVGARTYLRWRVRMTPPRGPGARATRVRHRRCRHLPP